MCFQQTEYSLHLLFSLPVASKASFSLESLRELLKDSFLLLETLLQLVRDAARASALFFVMSLGTTIPRHGECCGGYKRITTPLLLSSSVQFSWGWVC